MINSSAFTGVGRTLTRREFLRACGVSLAGIMLPFPKIHRSNIVIPNNDELLGRVTFPGHRIFREPDPDSKVLEEMTLDSLWEITSATISQNENWANRIWYELDRRGYAHSSRIQPVRNRLNPTDTTIPEDGCLGEVTVPFVDAYKSMEAGSAIVYRFYYASTFWILSRVLDPAGSVWYELLDDRWYQSFFIPAETMRLVPESELTAISPDVSPEDKLLKVDLLSQMMWAYEGEEMVFMARISSGIRMEEGGFATPKGHYRTIRKRPCRHMANSANAFGSGFDLPGVPWVSYFTSDGVAFHGAYWHNDFGNPHSHGCINMAPQDAKWVYRWTMPTVPADQYFFSGKDGTRVIVQ